jgi:dipeptidase E
MKLLLTSTGITNPTIEAAFLELAGKAAADIKLAYIPTAINVSSVADKRWAIDNIVRFDTMGIGTFDIVDFSAVPKELRFPRLSDADVLFFEGGTPTYLIDQINKAGLLELLLGEFQNKLIVGASSGSAMFGQKIIKTAADQPNGYKLVDAFGVVDFSMRPHYLHPQKSQFTDELIASIAQETGSDFYALDDQSAIVVTANSTKVISEGTWKLLQHHS